MVEFLRQREDARQLALTGFARIEEKGLTYVAGIRRSDSHLDYSCLRERDNSGMDGQFEYEGGASGTRISDGRIRKLRRAVLPKSQE